MSSQFKIDKRFVSLFLLFLSFFLIQACPDPPYNKPELANCPIGQNPCEYDSTSCCWDTTSHKFTWEIDTLGDYGELHDVQIIDENNIWVVGEIETDSGRFGAAQWNGVYWELKKLKGPGIVVSTITPRGLWYFSEDNIWFASGSIYHWDGIETSLVWLRDTNTDETVEKIWASSENDIYFVGKEGTIVHYDGTSFSKMNSGTTIWLKSITGFKDSDTGLVHIWAGGWEDLIRGQVIYYNGTDWNKIWDDNNPFYEDNNYLDPGAIWRADDENIVLYVGGSEDGIIVNHSLKDFNNHQILYYETGGAFHDINGNSINDQFYVGDQGNVLHFNGSTVKPYPELNNTIKYSAVDMSNDLVIICRNYSPIIVRGNRYY